MTVLIDRPQQNYGPNANGSPRVYALTRTIPPGTVNSLKINLTDPGNWPAGLVGTARLTGPDGPAGEFPIIGGIAKDRAQNIRTVRSAEFKQYTVFADGTTAPKPFAAGDYTLAFEVLQPAASAVTVEWF